MTVCPASKLPLPTSQSLFAQMLSKDSHKNILTYYYNELIERYHLDSEAIAFITDMLRDILSSLTEEECPMSVVVLILLS